MGVEIKLCRTQPNSDKVYAGFNQPRSQQQALAEFVPAEPRGLGCFFQRKIESFSGGWRTDDVVRLLTETVKATNLFVEILVTTKCGVQIIKKLLFLDDAIFYLQRNWLLRFRCRNPKITKLIVVHSRT